VDAWSDITTPEFITHLTLIHKLVAPEVNQSPQESPASLYRDNNGVKVKTNELMGPDNRLQFIEDTLEQVKSLLQEVDSQDPQSQEAALVRISNAIALATVITHTFEDGNDRTARTLALLIRGGIPILQEDIDKLELVSSNRPTDATSRRITSFIPAYRSDDPQEIWQKSIDSAISKDLPLTKGGQEQYERVKEFFSPFIDTLD
jgi:prophage maintenance system killer protein